MVRIELSKLDNVKILAKDRKVAKHIPKTYSLTNKSLTSMLKQNSFVYLKPNDSGQGKGLMRIDVEKGLYRLRCRDYQVNHKHEKISTLMEDIQKLKRKRLYLVQQGIQSETKKGRLFDLRVHMLRIKGEWKVVGIVGRLAPSKSIVTNAKSGGKPTKVDVLFQKELGWNEKQSKSMLKKLESLSIKIAQQFSAKYPKWRQFGLDYGIDDHNHPWLYEINVTPGLNVFRLADQSLYRKIIHLRHRSS
ncbi:YheC/YheD family protein [Hazenella coriacea]|uniref:YheC/D-like protein n=1 Tax=Hazenella coriacea TaxID=1179467 RepID=A0A4R3LEG4_9BACL|nr:YheC/YheD family protein [Hazenella coriacea]TCS95846.1 YheC/D-like protein [Hazenella coriacea]